MSTVKKIKRPAQVRFRSRPTTDAEPTRWISVAENARAEHAPEVDWARLFARLRGQRHRPIEGDRALRKRIQREERRAARDRARTNGRRAAS